MEIICKIEVVFLDFYVKCDVSSTDVCKMKANLFKIVAQPKALLQKSIHCAPIFPAFGSVLSLDG